MSAAEPSFPELPPLEAYADEADRSQPRAPTHRIHVARDVPLLAIVWFAAMGNAAAQEFLVHNLIVAKSLFVVFGESNSGKTFLVIYLALCIAAGMAAFDRPVRQGLVVYVAAEGASSVQNRVAAFRKEHPGINSGIPFAVIGSSIDLLSARDVDRLIATVKDAESLAGEQAVLIIFDTFARCMSGDENSSQDVGTAIAACDRIRAATNAAVCLVHHSGKDASRGARGSNALRCAVDTEIYVEGQNGVRTATTTKQRDLVSGERMAFELVPIVIGEDGDGKPISSCHVRHIETERSQQPVRDVRPLGKWQKALLRAVEAQARDAAAARRAGNQTSPLIWSASELRSICRSLGAGKTSAHDAANWLMCSPLMTATIGGVRLANEP